MSAILQRETFEISRMMEYFTRNELIAQMGLGPDQWPAALLKELLDNALDATESCGRPPEIAVTLEPHVLIVEDNGPGLPLEVIERSLDYTARISDKLGYISPSRGQQGNALKCLWATPFVATNEGRIGIETAGQRYEVRVALDRLTQQPRVTLVCSGDTDVKKGTRISLHWRGIASSLDQGNTLPFYNLLSAFAALNPHAKITVNEQHTFSATAPDWTHWRPNRPTSPHWYTQDHLRTLIALLLDADRRAGGRTRSVNEFVRQFNGLSSTLKAAAVTKAAGLHGAMLSDLINGDDLDPGKVRVLLTAMQQEAKPVKPEALGVVGEAHCRQTLQAIGSAPDSIAYRCTKGTTAGLPYVVEVGFGMLQSDSGSVIVRGVNFSPALGSPFMAVDMALSEALVQRYDPAVMLVHLACPRVEYTDRGKTHAQLPADISEALTKAIKLTTKCFTQAKRRADREDRLRENDLQALLRAEKAEKLTVKEAAYQVMAEAYLEASDNGTLVVKARQVMYKARPKIILLTDNPQPWKRSSYFTQELLPDFVEEHPDLCADWDIAFDDRGHFTEPHTGKSIGVGTLAVRDYIDGWHRQISAGLDGARLATRLKTSGPALRYRHVLFVEKEGFTALLQRAQIMERYDIGLLSTKGLSVTAARHLVESLSQHGVTILVLHDFDESGFKIIHTLRNDTRRYRFKRPPNVVDIGVRLTDVQAMGLQAEDVEYHRKEDPRQFLMSRGATKEEADFLVRGKRHDGKWLGQRVEIDAMSSRQLIDWLERKLDEHGVAKLIPDEADLEKAWSRAWRIRQVNEAVAKAIKGLDDLPSVPPDLRERLQKYLEENPAVSWDVAVAKLTEEDDQ